jgi:hypothetical protein
MQLDLNPTEVNDLREALQAIDKQLLRELAHADDREYRDMLREKVIRIEALLRRVDAHTGRQSDIYA